MRAARLLFLMAVVLLALAAALWERSLHAADRVRADLAVRAPIGTSRAKVDELLPALGLQVAAFDYPGGDPRHGTLIIGKTRPALSFRDVHCVFHFDHAGAQGRLTEVEVSDLPIDVPSP